MCKHGCRYNTIQKAVNASGANATINVKPGKYVEGVIVQGHRHDGLHIIGVGKKPSAVLIEGKNAKGPGGAAQNGIDGESVNNLDLENMKAEHFASNGFFINTCKGYLMKNLIAGFNRSYGLYVFKCIGGRMTESVGYGNGDSAFYVGGTPFQKHPVKTLVDHDTGYKNVLGYSGTNSKYIVIRDSEFYNNGAGVVPNTLKSEPDQPATSGVIEDNLIYWNNFDYYRPGSPVRTVSSGVGTGRGELPDRRRRDPVRHHRLDGQVTTPSSATSCGAARRSRTRRTRPARPRTTPTGSSATRWARRSRTPTALTSTTMARAREPALRTTRPDRRSTPARPTRTCTRAARAARARARSTATRPSSASSRAIVLADPPTDAGELLARALAPQAPRPHAVRGVIG